MLNPSPTCNQHKPTSVGVDTTHQANIGFYLMSYLTPKPALLGTTKITNLCKIPQKTVPHLSSRSFPPARHELREQFVQLTTAAAFAGYIEALATEEIFAARWPGHWAGAAAGRKGGNDRRGNDEGYGKLFTIYGGHSRLKGTQATRLVTNFRP